LGVQERRLAIRRPKQIRFRFTALANEHRAVTTTVSRIGAFAKASYVPGVGTTVTLEEVYGRGTARLWLRAEVTQAVETPTLEQSETGFGMRFIEAYTQDDPLALEEFIRYLDPAMTEMPSVTFEERKDGIFSVHRFEYVDDPEMMASATEAPPEPAEELFELDLTAELDRLEREARPIKVDTPVSAPPSEAPAAAELAPRKERSRRRSVTGIFTALFQRQSNNDADED
jgi:hypothetical protein